MTAQVDQDRLFLDAQTQFGGAIDRLARGYELNADRRRDLVQDIHLALWRSLRLFDGRCSLRTWVYRVAHNTATSHVLKERRAHAARWVSLDHADGHDSGADIEDAAHQSQIRERLTQLIQQLEPPDRQVILLYLDGVDTAGIAEITGLSAGHTATKIHRIKALLGRRFQQGGRR